MCNRVLPNFKMWADRIMDRDDLVEALQQSFEQGWSAGYMDGQENGWIDTIEHDPHWQEEQLNNYHGTADIYEKSQEGEETAS